MNPLKIPPQKNSLARWYAVYTKPHYEKKVAKQLEEKGVQYFLPLIKTIRFWSDRRKKVEIPLFSSYLFVHINESEHLKVLQTTGVVRFITFEGKKVPIRVVEIAAIKKYVETGEEEIINETEFTPGRKVRVIRGALKGLSGQLIQVLGKQLVKVEIDVVGQSIFLKIPIGQLELLP